MKFGLSEGMILAAGGGERPHRIVTFDDGADAPEPGDKDLVTTRHAHALRPQPDRLPAHRRRAHGAVQLAVRAPARRPVHPAHRRHRPAAQRRGGARADPARLPLARPRLGRRPRGRRPARAVLPVAARRPLPGRRRRAAAPRARLPRLRHAPRRWRPSARRPRRRSASSCTAAAGWPRRAEDRARFEAEGRKGVVRLKMPREGTLRAARTSSAATSSSMGAGAGPRHPARRRLVHLSPGQRRRRPRLRHHPRHPRRGAPVEHAAADLHRRRRWAIPLPAYAHLPYVAEPGSKNKLSKRKLDAYLKNPDFAKVHQHGTAIAAAMELDDHARDVQPGDRRFLRAGRLPARRDPQLPGAARLVARRQDRVLHARADDRELLARAREQGAGQLRSRQAARVPGALHARPAARRQGRGRAAVPRARRPGRRRPSSDDTRAYVGPHRRGAGRSPQGVRRHPAAGAVLLRRRGHVRRQGVRQARARARRRRAPGRLPRLARRPDRVRRRRAGSRHAGPDRRRRASAWATSSTPSASPSPASPSAPGLFDCAVGPGQADLPAPHRPHARQGRRASRSAP